MSITENKMFLINNRYLMHDLINSHYSSAGSKCSDYELAQYVLFYMQAARLFGDEERVCNEMVSFREKHGFEFSYELRLAVNLCITYLRYVLRIEIDADSGNEFIDKVSFMEAKRNMEEYLNSTQDDDSGIFDEWIKIFLNQDLAYLYMLFGQNTSNEAKLRTSLFERCIHYVDDALTSIDALNMVVSSKDNNDDVGILSLVRAYIYRNKYIAMCYMNSDSRLMWLEKSLRERSSLKSNFTRGTVDSQIYEYFTTEYYLTISEMLSECIRDPENSILDELDKMMYIDEIDTYLDKFKNRDHKNTYVEKIKLYRDMIN